MDFGLLSLVFKYLLLYIAFFLLSLVVFYSPGYLMLLNVKKDLEEQEIVALSLVLSLILFVITAFLLGFLNIRILMLPLILGINLFVFYKYKLIFLKPLIDLFKDKSFAGLIILGIFILGIIDFPSGFKFQQGYLFWSSQGHDGIWHVAVIEEIKNTLPAKNPLFAGEDLYNYHYLIDVSMGEFKRIFPFFESLDIYFRFFPILLALMIGVSVFAFVTRWQKSKLIGYWAIFFTFFCGSFGFIYTYIKEGHIFGGETAFWAAQGNTILGNPPHAAAFALLPAFLLCFYIYLQKRSKNWFLITFLVGCILAGFKVSGGIVMLAGIGTAALLDLWNTRKFHTLFLVSLLGLSNYSAIKLMTRGAEGFLIFLPWWFIRTMVVSRLDWIDLENKRQFYLERGGFRAILRIIQFEGMAFLIFLLGNMGMRIVGFIEVFRKFVLDFKKTVFNPFEIGLFVTMLTGFVMPMLFVQKGIIYNNIQFFQYFDLIFGFFAAISTVKIIKFLKNKALRYVFVFLIIFLSIPTVLGNINEFYGPKSNPLAIISNQEIEALNFLKNNSQRDDVVLNLPFNKYLGGKFEYQPKPIFSWYSTAYISALTGRRSYLSSEEQVLIMGYPLEERKKRVHKYFEDTDFAGNMNFLKANNIKFVYLPKKELQKPFNAVHNGLTTFFENEEVLIYKFQ